MNVLLVEDELRVADFVRRGLSAEGWGVTHVSDGESALDLLSESEFDAIILDLMLPGISGQDVCRKLRARANLTPVLMLSALDSTDERIAGLKLGADDYLPKPFDFDELVARLEALHRRMQRYTATPNPDLLDGGGVSFDKRSLTVLIDDAPLDLSGKEREILLLLMSNKGRTFSRERILNSVWGMTSDPLTNVVDVYIGRLRRKLRHHGNRIVTLRNVGYRFD